MKEVSSCAVCGEMTTRFLFNDKKLGIPICSRKCEYGYFNNLTLNMREQETMLRYLDDKIKATKLHEKIGWVIAGFGLLIASTGFLAKNTAIFIIGVFSMACGALSTSYFQDKRNKVVRLRKRILI